MLSWYRRRSPVARRLLVLVTTLLLVGLALGYIPTGLYVTAPGAALETDRMIRVPGEQENPGRLMMLVVAAQPANLFWYLYAKVDDRAQLETPRQFLGEIRDYREYVKLSQAMMRDSQQAAKAIGLQLAGKGKGAVPTGVEIVSFTGDSPNKGVLNEGDVIVRMDGQPVAKLEEMRVALARYKPGQKIPAVVQRGGQEVALDLPTYENPDRKGVAALGVYPKTSYQFDIPVDVEIASGSITGPSAGLMFSLTIVDKLTPGGITGGLAIAGTGTIEPDGTVGRIGGARQKTFAAEVAGASVMFVPPDNYEEARRAATRIQVVPVATVFDALVWLKENRPRK